MAKNAIDLLLEISKSQKVFEKFIYETDTIDQLKKLFGKEYEWPGDKEAQKILDAKHSFPNRGVYIGDSHKKY